ncbi:metal-sensing transcriptional repressor [Devosia neptuniae]|jgi:DNA-binding FrmR family transcriptional regulator|uniref:Metal-sensing transcriptional repressor n=1 Tax=Devosia neptuniae TaxID=191302 RepID=A0ABY6CJS7_9HYPH|nr:metal-sensing transcriptional repressor [Devosia neptuniae]UXN71276.1 metal-sensing transcriptional repressor [Devosia neptuniae]
MSHIDDPQIHARLRRAEGHLSKVVKMVAEGQDGLAIAQQMSAVISALEKAKQLIIIDHIDHHLADSDAPLPPEIKSRLAVFREITKYL